MAKCLVFISIVIVCIALLYWRMYSVLQLDKGFKELNAEGCTLLSGIIGAEDSAQISSDVIIFSSDDRMKLWESPGIAKDVPNGGLFVLYSNNNELRTSQLLLNDFPNHVKFHPHGIYLLKEDEKMMLYVVNHAYSDGGERVDVFEVRLESNNDIPVSVHYKYSVGNEFFSKYSNGILNDILVLREGSFFITQYLAFQDPQEGRKYGMGINGILNLLSVIFKLQWASIRYCTYNPLSDTIDKSVECTIVANGSSYNGINRNNQGNILFVSDPTEREIHTYKLEENTKLSLLKKIKLPHSVDNIELEESTNSHFLGSITGSVLTHIKRIHSRSFNSSDLLFNPGGAMQLFFNNTSYEYTVNELISQNGEQLSSIAIACPFQSSFIILGSWEDNGILICPK